MKPYLRITLWYLLFGGLWIALTDRLVGPVSESVEALTGWQTLKGGLYVLISGCLIYFLTRGAHRRQEHAERKRLEEFRRTVKQSRHILLNYFNQMQLVILEAERSVDFDKSLIGLARETTEMAADEVRKLDGENSRACGDEPVHPENH
ncbi:MAG: hypothetical protein WC003_09965 [Terrimicrobiaceae bacterium]